MADVSKKRDPRAEGARRYGPAPEKVYQFLLWLIPTVEKFPRGQRFLLGDRIQTTALDVLEGIDRRNVLARGGRGTDKG